MSSRKYRVTLYFSSYITREVEAETEDIAYATASSAAKDVEYLYGKEIFELINNLEPWEEADEVEEIEDDD